MFWRAQPFLQDNQQAAHVIRPEFLRVEPQARKDLAPQHAILTRLQAHVLSGDQRVPDDPLLVGEQT